MQTQGHTKQTPPYETAVVWWNQETPSLLFQPDQPYLLKCKGTKMQQWPKGREENLEQKFLNLEVLKPLAEWTYLAPQAAEQDLVPKKSCSSPQKTPHSLHTWLKTLIWVSAVTQSYLHGFSWGLWAPPAAAINWPRNTCCHPAHTSLLPQLGAGLSWGNFSVPITKYKSLLLLFVIFD